MKKRQSDPKIELNIKGRRRPIRSTMKKEKMMVETNLTVPGIGADKRVNVVEGKE